MALVLATTAAGGVSGVAAALPAGITNPVCTTTCADDAEGQGAGAARLRGWWRSSDADSRLRGQGRGQGSAGGNGRSGNGLGSGGPTGGHSDIPPAVEGAQITDEVAAELAYLAEEEKLAGDVYDLAATSYGLRIFDNIGRSEDNHLAEVRVLLDRYDVTDPTLGADAGKFTDPQLQALYDTLAAQVRSSRAGAVAAGILIERTDIADLEELLENRDLPADVQAVAESLHAGSQRHLAAFQRTAA
jgi:hypothetical protein